MCGVAGWASTGAGNASAPAFSVEQMVSAMHRRGPDAQGIDHWADAVLGHRRLAIFDLSDLGRQPMTSSDRTIAVVFNGAIYNFHSLRSDLVGRGYQFKSDTDTEVLVHGYSEWGLDGLVSRIRGMFAFGLWDDRIRKLFLVRDRLGVKPLFYVSRDGMIAFASTARALRAGGLVRNVDRTALMEYLEFGYVTDGRSIYEGASKVPAASVVEWSSVGLQIRQYWSPPSVDRLRENFSEAVEETERLLLKAVEARLQADVPVGALLSSGIDSSLVCWSIVKLGGDVTAYTVGTAGDSWDETTDARRTARELGIAHEVRDLQPADDPGIDEMVSAYGEPFACASALGMLRMSQAVSSTAKVLLTGDGGDDVFLGYPEHQYLRYAQHLAPALPPGCWWPLLRQAIPRRGVLRRAVTFMDFATGGLGGLTRAHDGLPMYERGGLLGERLQGATLAQRCIPWSRESAKKVLSEFLEYDRAGRFVAEYMTKVDGATMFHGIEARSPFLDQELWEFGASLPFSVRLRGGRSKAVLRELARRRIGARVAHGRKRGFGVPVQRWMVGRWRKAVEDMFQDPVFEREGWIRRNAARKHLEMAAQQGWAPKQLWYLYVLESWLRLEKRDARASQTAKVLA
jgi:asparagine synthase (glutamine-hydrolysing)